jgi:hypothetical protein
MDCTIVYKTYENDLKWLKYSLISVNKYVDNINEIIIYYHDKCYENLNNIIKSINAKIPIRLIPVIYDIHGYLKQMVIKCMCFNDVNTSHILFIDSDVIFKKKYTYKNLIENDKISWYILKRTPQNYNEDQWITWEKSVYNMTNNAMNIYYMYNGFPFLIKKDTLHDAYNKFIEIHNKDYNTYCKEYLTKLNININDSITGSNGKFRELATIFEEFEYFGWYANNFTDNYLFIESPSNNSEYLTQYWSHGGLNSNIESEILHNIN